MTTESASPYRAMREATGLSLRAVSRALGMNSGRLSIIERGVPPTDEERRKLNAFLGEQLTKAPEPGEATA